MADLYHTLLIAVITGNATVEQQAAFDALVTTDTDFVYLYKQLQVLYSKNNATRVFDVDKAFGKLKKRLGR